MPYLKNIEIIHKPGPEMVMMDPLNRMPPEGGSLGLEEKAELENRKGRMDPA